MSATALPLAAGLPGAPKPLVGRSLSGAILPDCAPLPMWRGAAFQGLVSVCVVVRTPVHLLHSVFRCDFFVAQRDVQVCPKTRLCASMFTAAQTFDDKRAKVVDLVAKLTEERGSKMGAYEALGSMLGTSSMWVRRIVGRRDDVRIDHHVALQIRDIHDRLCVRVARAAEAAEARNALLQEQIDAAVLVAGAPAARLASAPAAEVAAPQRPARPSASALAFTSPRTRGPAQASLELNDLPLWQHPAAPR